MSRETNRRLPRAAHACTRLRGACTCRDHPGGCRAAAMATRRSRSRNSGTGITSIQRRKTGILSVPIRASETRSVSLHIRHLNFSCCGDASNPTKLLFHAPRRYVVHAYVHCTGMICDPKSIATTTTKRTTKSGEFLCVLVPWKHLNLNT